jgi:hypothetical protein
MKSSPYLFQSLLICFLFHTATSLLFSATTSGSVQQCGNTTTFCPASAVCCPAQYSPTACGCQLAPSSPCCLPGPALEASKILPNCLVIGDSVSIGYTGIAAIQLSDICQLQHAPFDVSDGGAGSTGYGQACLDNFLKTQRQTMVEWDVILFNFGLHNLDDNSTSIYRQQLSNITKRLVSFTLTKRSKLIYAITTPYMPYASVGNHIVSQLNKIALDIIRPYNDIKVLDLHKLVTDHWYAHACMLWLETLVGWID